MKWYLLQSEGITSSRTPEIVSFHDTQAALKHVSVKLNCVHICTYVCKNIHMYVGMYVATYIRIYTYNGIHC